MGGTLGASPAIAMLSTSLCGLIVVDPLTLLVVYQSAPTTVPAYEFSGQDGAHSHPIFDSLTTNFYFVDYADYRSVASRVCCKRMSDSQNCAGWVRSDGCVDVPTTGTYDDGTGTTIFGKWSFISLSFYNSYLYVSASGAMNDDVAFARYGYKSIVYVIVRTRALSAPHFGPCSRRAQLTLTPPPPPSLVTGHDGGHERAYRSVHDKQ